MKLSDFLKQKGVYEKVIEYALDTSKLVLQEYNDKQKGDILMSLFPFSETLEGYNFWYELDRETMQVVTQWDMFFKEKRDISVA